MADSALEILVITRRGEPGGESPIPLPRMLGDRRDRPHLSMDIHGFVLTRLGGLVRLVQNCIERSVDLLVE